MFAYDIEKKSLPTGCMHIERKIGLPRTFGQNYSRMIFFFALGYKCNKRNWRS